MIEIAIATLLAAMASDAQDRARPLIKHQESRLMLHLVQVPVSAVVPQEEAEYPEIIEQVRALINDEWDVEEVLSASELADGTV